MHDDTNACNYGIGIGVLAFLFCIGFLVLDAMFDNISNIQHRKYAVIADIGVSGKLLSPAAFRNIYTVDSHYLDFAYLE